MTNPYGSAGHGSPVQPPSTTAAGAYTGGGYGTAPIQQQPGVHAPGQYPATPYPAGQYGRRPRPAPLWIASMLVWLTCLAYLAAGLAILLYRDRITELITGVADIEEFWPLIETFVTALAAPFIAIAVVIALVSVAAIRGSNAARWAIVIIVGVGALLPLMGLLAGEITSLPFLIFQIAVITLYALPVCSRWYADRARRTGK